MYSTQTDLEERLDPQLLRALSDDDADGLADPGVVAAAIGDADALIDAHLRARYPIPLDPVPDLVKSISATVAVYFLLTRRSEIVPEVHLKRYEAAIQLLDHIARGQLSLGAGQPAAASHRPQSNRTADDRTFDVDSLSEF